MPLQPSNNSAMVDAGKVLQLIQVGSVFGKRANDAIEKVAAEKKAAEKVAEATLAALLTSGAISESQKTAAANALGSHEQTLNLLRNAAVKIGELKKTGGGTKEAGDLGRGEGDATVAGDGSPKTAASLHNPFVGQRQGQGDVRESDRVFLEGLGLNAR